MSFKLNLENTSKINKSDLDVFLSKVNKASKKQFEDDHDFIPFDMDIEYCNDLEFSSDNEYKWMLDTIISKNNTIPTSIKTTEIFYNGLNDISTGLAA